MITQSATGNVKALQKGGLAEGVTRRGAEMADCAFG
jgi:hypothetical protein